MFAWTDFAIEQRCRTYRHTVDLDVCERRVGPDVQKAFLADDVGRGARIICRRRTGRARRRSAAFFWSPIIRARGGDACISRHTGSDDGRALGASRRCVISALEVPRRVLGFCRYGRRLGGRRGSNRDDGRSDSTGRSAPRRALAMDDEPNCEKEQ